MRRMSRWIPVLLLAVAAPAAADWLVTRSGDEIETAGAWEERGGLVVFTNLDGRLSSLRARDVDLEASRERTDAPPVIEAEPPAEPAHKGPVLVITDADVRHVASDLASDEPASEALETPSGPQDGSETPESAEGTVEVVSWQDRLNVQANALEVYGTLVNNGSSVVTDANVQVRLLDRDGDLLESRRAALAQRTLSPGGTGSFSATFPGSPGYASIEFEVQSRGFRVRPAPQAPVDP